MLQSAMSTKVVMFSVSSINGLITFQNNPDIYDWTSIEDSDLFLNAIEKSDAIIMGSKTYESNKSKIKLNPKHPRFVLTKNPDKYLTESVKGQLNFTNQSPTEIINSLKDNCRIILVVGGGEINSLFLENKLVDELHLTIEPLIFGSGKNLISQSLLKISCKLLKFKKLNKNGTLHLVYKINYEKN